MKIDLHVHVSTFSRCSCVDPSEVVPAAIRAKLDAVVITDHNTAWPKKKFRCFDNDQVMVFNGMEVTAGDGHDYLVIGPDLQGFYAGMPPEELSYVAASNEAALILAHPFRFDLDVPIHLKTMQLAAVEVCSNSMYGPHERVLADQLCRELGTAAVSSSDAHIPAAIGTRYTITKRGVSSIEELAHCLMAHEVEPLAALRGPARVYDHIKHCQIRRIRRVVARGVRGLEKIKAATGAPMDIIEQVVSDPAS